MNLTSILLLAAALIAAIATAAMTIRPTRRIRAAARQTHEEDPVAAQAGEMPSLTVVVYDYARSGDLDEYLQALDAQDYPDFSAVIVSNVSAAEARDMEEVYGRRYPRMHFTFIPPGSHSLSRRKLALTVGIKAAKGDYVLTTLSNCRIPSPRWLSLMMKPVTEQEGKEICLGLSKPDFTCLRGAGRWYRQFDATLRTAQWISAALAGRSFRGDGFNLLFRRELFFEAKGYSRTVYYNPGDDDLFLTQIADGTNTAVQLDPEAVLLQDWGTQANKFMAERKERCDFTRPLLPKQPFLKAAAVSWMQWIALAASAAAVAVSLTADGCSPSTLYTLIGAVVVLFAFWGMEIALYRTLAASLGSTRLWWATVPFLLWHPIGNMLFRMRHHSSRDRNFTWRN